MVGSPASPPNAPLRTTRILRISPKFATDDMEATARFYEELLGFRVLRRDPDYLILERDGLLIHFARAASSEVMQAMRNHAEFYLEVRNIEPLWEHVQRYRDRYRIRDLFDRDYGMREFHIADPNGVLIFVGEVIG